MDIKQIKCEWLGRYDPAEKNCSLWWSGSGIRVKAACSWLTITAEHTATEHAPWIGVLIDGAPVARFPLLPGKRVYPVVAGMDPAFPHEITIQRDSQPTPDETGPVVITDMDTDGTLMDTAPRERLIEFIGDSLTVGEGCTGPHSAEEWRMAWLCNMAAFPTLVAEELRAEKRVVALSGWGAWKSWDCLEEHRLGLVYEKLCAAVPSGDCPYDFKERSADAVVINLGTNDSNAIQQEDDSAAAGRQLTARCVELLAMVRRHQPNAVILWAYGLCGNPIEQLIRQAVEQRRQTGDGAVFYLPLTDCEGDVGSRQHPSRAAHRRAAAEIVKALSEIWQNKTTEM